MSRLTLRLPETLHRQLEFLAKSENTSLNQYIVYALTRQVTQTYTVVQVPKEDVERQQANFNALRKSLRKGSPGEIREALDSRKAGDVDPVIQSDEVRRLRAYVDSALGASLSYDDQGM